MKTCSKCNTPKEEIEFVTSKRTKSGFKAYCKFCAQEQQKEYFLKNRDKRMKQIKTNMKNWKAALRIEIDALKNNPCMDCGGSFPPIAMDFDHRDATTKVANISLLVVKRTVSRQRIFEEIAKCDLVCSNCHRIRTQNRHLAQRLEQPDDNWQVKSSNLLVSTV